MPDNHGEIRNHEDGKACSFMETKDSSVGNEQKVFLQAAAGSRGMHYSGRKECMWFQRSGTAKTSHLLDNQLTALKRTM